MNEGIEEAATNLWRSYRDTRQAFKDLVQGDPREPQALYYMVERLADYVAFLEARIKTLEAQGRDDLTIGPGA